jgi:hypothetical protein
MDNHTVALIILGIAEAWCIFKQEPHTANGSSKIPQTESD